MHPLARTVPRFLFQSVNSSALSRTYRLSNRPSIRPSICVQCKIRTQIRRYADSPKPTTPPSSSQPSSESESSGATPITEDAPTELPSAEDNRRSDVTKRLSHLMDHLQGNIFVASQRINDLTGYSGIEALKERITQLEKRVADAQELVRSSRNIYKTTVADRASTQREVTGLLARKDTWNPTDLERFTALYRMDHSNEQAVQESATKLADAEREAETAASKLSSSILSRYHEEQIWSDKIRRMSTWGTWGLMGVNVLLFLVFQFGFEPWRRRRLVQGFEDKVKDALEKEKEKLLHIQELERQAAETVPVDDALAARIQELEEEIRNYKTETQAAAEAVASVPEGEISDENSAIDVAEVEKPILDIKNPETWRPAAEDLFSERPVHMRKQDVTIVALEGAATGVVLTAIIATLLRLS